MLASKGQADHVVDLLVPAGAQAAGALNTGVQIDRNGRVRHILRHLMTCFKTWLTDADLSRPLVHLVVAGVGFFRHVRQQQLKHHLLRCHGPLAVGLDLHAGGGRPAARGRQHPLAVDLDHAGAAIANGLQAFLEAQVRYLNAFALGYLQE